MMEKHIGINSKYEIVYGGREILSKYKSKIRIQYNIRY